MSLHALRPFAPFVLSSCWLLTSSVQAATQDTTPAALELENTPCGLLLQKKTAHRLL